MSAIAACCPDMLPRQKLVMRALAVLGLAAALIPASPALALMSDSARTAFLDSCEQHMAMSAGECVCMADIAETALDVVGVAYLSLDPLDGHSAADMAGKMTLAQIDAVEAFMETAPLQCRGAN